MISYFQGGRLLIAPPSFCPRRLKIFKYAHYTHYPFLAAGGPFGGLLPLLLFSIYARRWSRLAGKVILPMLFATTGIMGYAIKNHFDISLVHIFRPLF